MRDLLCGKCSVNVDIIIVISGSVGFQAPSQLLSLGPFRAPGAGSVLGGSSEGCLCQDEVFFQGRTWFGRASSPSASPGGWGGRADLSAAGNSFERFAKLGFCPWPKACWKDTGCQEASR